VNEVDKIIQIVRNVRLALETDRVKASLAGLNDFPYGSCLDASLLLGIVLEEAGYMGFYMICGEMEGYDKQNQFYQKSHAWLESEKYLIDITPDQFDVESKYVLIVKSGNIDNHLGFTPVSKSELDLGYTGWAWPTLKNELNKQEHYE
jgi:hypothetical protein